MTVKNESRSERLHHQRAIVTGASSGIGAGIARRLAAEGASVVVGYSRDEAGAAAVVRDIESQGGRAFAQRANVDSEADVEALFRRTTETWGGLDILVCNAGIQKDAPLWEMTKADWDAVIATNLTGQFLCAREAVRLFRKQPLDPARSRSRGKIVCISSVHDVIPWAGHANYAASKGGVAMLMKTMAQEVASLGIRVSSVSPGAIRTRINREAWSTPEAERELLKLIPYGRVGEADDVARAVAWLASDEADYVTGTTLYVDGGMVLYPEFRDGG
jgi:glucose 1-dehydrogenase